MKTHKHKGVERSNGTLRPHPIDRKHKDKQVQKWHDQEIKNSGASIKSTKTKKAKQPKQKSFGAFSMPRILESKKRLVSFEVDKDGYVLIDFDNFEYNGLRLKRTQRQGRTRRTVGMQIPKSIDLF